MSSHIKLAYLLYLKHMYYSPKLHLAIRYQMIVHTIISGSNLFLLYDLGIMQQYWYYTKQNLSITDLEATKLSRAVYAVVSQTHCCIDNVIWSYVIRYY